MEALGGKIVNKDVINYLVEDIGNIGAKVILSIR